MRSAKLENRNYPMLLASMDPLPGFVSQRQDGCVRLHSAVCTRRANMEVLD
jgi:hypothetical protein